MIPRHSQRATAEADEVAREIASHDAYEAIAELYRRYEPQTAHWIATLAIITADRDYRRRRSNGNS